MYMGIAYGSVATNLSELLIGTVNASKSYLPTAGHVMFACRFFFLLVLRISGCVTGMDTVKRPV